MAEKIAGTRKKNEKKEPKLSKKENSRSEKGSSNRKKASSEQMKALNKPNLRTIYSNNRNTLMPLGLGTDFRTKKCVVIFSDLLTGQVHTTALSIWNRMKLKEVKELNPQI